MPVRVGFSGTGRPKHPVARARASGSATATSSRARSSGPSPFPAPFDAVVGTPVSSENRVKSDALRYLVQLPKWKSPRKIAQNGSSGKLSPFQSACALERKTGPSLQAGAASAGVPAGKLGQAARVHGSCENTCYRRTLRPNRLWRASHCKIEMSLQPAQPIVITGPAGPVL
jgi:hypothetical protein